jgi:hypothetical protein
MGRGKVKLEFVDRHAEHVNDELPLCAHATRYLQVGDIWKGSGELGGTIYCQVEVEFLAKDHIRVTINHLDYLLEKRVKDGVQAKLASWNASVGPPTEARQDAPERSENGSGAARRLRPRS